MTDSEYFEALRAAVNDGDEQAAAVLRLLESRRMIPTDFQTFDAEMQNRCSSAR